MAELARRIFRRPPEVSTESAVPKATPHITDQVREPNRARLESFLTPSVVRGRIPSDTGFYDFDHRTESSYPTFVPFEAATENR